MLYFDHSATTPLQSEVKELMRSINENNYGNPSSIYSLGQKARIIIETSRKQVADAIGASSEQILFTSSGTESNNQVLWTLIFSIKKHVITFLPTLRPLIFIISLKSDLLVLVI